MTLDDSPVWRPEDISAPWLDRVLHEAGLLRQSHVTGFGIEPVGTGQMGDSYRFHLTHDGGPRSARPARPARRARPARPALPAPASSPHSPGPATVVGKFTASDETSRAVGVAMRTAEAEVSFYREIAPTLPARVPACYHACVDPATARFAILMEDLAPARQGDQLAGCSVNEAAAALAELARVHAPRWGDPALTRLAWLNRRDERATAALTELYPALFRAFVERHSERMDPRAVTVGERFFPHVGEYLRHQPGPHTVQHADYRLDNLLIRDGPNGRPEIAIVDWQTVILGPGCLDASYFLGASLLPAERRAHERELFAEYHRALLALGVEGYGFDDAWRDYRRYAYAGYLMAVTAAMMVERTDRGDTMFLAMANRHACQIEDLESERLLGAP